MTADQIISALNLAPHPEGGHYRETWRAPTTGDARGAGTAIYYLLTAGERSHWHRIDAVEIWHFYAGAPLALSINDGSTNTQELRLGTDLENSELPQAIVPAHAWQSAISTGAWSLVGCTVAPAFQFETFEMAPRGWAPAFG
ncbi:MAG: cupin domain-containing protein [Alphaproteobacteria bacterium]|jgi:uncharacterized protein|nr:cupin domain-containing protein [Alphaproteobacteria bacterium]